MLIYNTLSSKKESFIPQKSPTVSMYVCGITPYDYAHIGHGRVYVVFDILYRLLTFLDYDVTYCRNFTDIDDKLINRALKTLGDPYRYKEIASEFIKAFHEDVETLNCLQPTFEPRVTEHIREIIDFIQGLIANNKAYVVNGNVFYRIQSFPSYGKLSKQNIEELQVGARVQANEQKENPLDFALWKSEQEGAFWQSPWGWGRPGWHIECSALARHYLGEQIDIHAGGMDLMFPHHENEIAQTEGLIDKQFSRYWIHNAFVRINKEKMSKSLGNFLTLRDVFKEYDPMVVRFFYIMHHYSAPLDFSFDLLEMAQKTYQKICLAFAKKCSCKSNEDIAKNTVVRALLEPLQDDLNTPGMLGILFSDLKKAANEENHCAVKLFLQRVLGLTLDPLPEKEIAITPEIQALIDAREEARKVKDFKKADALRDELQKLGFNVQDKKM